MSLLTSFLKLVKPDKSEKYNIQVFNDNADIIDEVVWRLFKQVGAYTWYIDSDTVEDKSGESIGALADCMTDDFTGTWFYVRTTSSEAGIGAYPSKYDIDGANGYLSLRDYVIWTGSRLMHIPVYEAKASTVKNSDGQYSPKSGVDGLMSSTQAAYLTDLINAYWGKNKLEVFTENAHLCNWCREDGIYVGGLGEDCGGHPPYTDGNKTNWILFVFNNQPNSTNPNNHRIQIAFDVSSCLMYMRKGWISSNTWADWVKVGDVADGSITEDKIANGAVTEDKLSENLQTQLSDFNTLPGSYKAVFSPTDSSTAVADLSSCNFSRGKQTIWLDFSATNQNYTHYLDLPASAANCSEITLIVDTTVGAGEFTYNLYVRVGGTAIGGGGATVGVSVNVFRTYTPVVDPDGDVHWTLSGQNASSGGSGGVDVTVLEDRIAALEGTASALEASQGSITIEGTDGVTYTGKLKTVNGKPVFEYEAVEGENQNE